MRYISLFSGIEAATVAWEPLGWEPIAFSEIDPFCCELLRQKYPDVPNLGDVTDVQSSVGRLSGSSSPNWRSSGIAWRGGFLTRNSSEWPNAAAVSSLSEALETHAPATHSLSPKACEGIIRRAERRGKSLPEPLASALKSIASKGR